jgi:tripartite-type tricarboxylate transporter receptor subunit TctC
LRDAVGQDRKAEELTMRKLTLALVAGLAVLALVPASAQTRAPALKIIYPYAGGGSGDALTRLIAEQLGKKLDRPVSPIAPMAVFPSVYPSLDYDAVADFSPVSQIATFDLGISIGPHVPATNLAELIVWLKANPRQANFGTPGAGTLPHFFGVMFARAAGINLQHVAYKGGSVALTDMMGGQIPIVFLSTNELTELHKGDRLRVLATSNTRRSEFLPEVPTFKESGFEIEGTGWWGMFAPAKTPTATVAKINAAIVEALGNEEIKGKIRRLGLQPTGTSADAFARIQRDDIARWAPAVKASGFTPEQ